MYLKQNKSSLLMSANSVLKLTPPFSVHYSQEKNKPVPALTSLNYGRSTRAPYDENETAFKRSHATDDFYRKRGILEIEDKPEVQ